MKHIPLSLKLDNGIGSAYFNGNSNLTSAHSMIICMGFINKTVTFKFDSMLIHIHSLLPLWFHPSRFLHIHFGTHLLHVCC
ncbi:hypothetical protein AQUCO_00200430v1 [Aquilegia coerulea]|uniref:Uncharacterized protein n=1 Tax=Aquilegia coerulea TaxID=218851 RepID=A0A2G5F326_AQUCA|nr:hypothetical protein AQUCO_00200430v1 [Aquilegia coerulea]